MRPAAARTAATLLLAAACAAAGRSSAPAIEGATARGDLPATSTRPAALTSLWRDDPSDPSSVRIDSVPGVTEPSGLLLLDASLYTISDSYSSVYRLDLGLPAGPLALGATWSPAGLPGALDLEAMARLPGGEVLLAHETDGTVFVLNPFPRHACAAWRTGVAGTCLIGKANCGIEAMAVIPGLGLFVAKEREPRAAWLFDLPEEPCRGRTLEGRTLLRLPDEVGPDVSAAAWHAPSGRLLVVGRSAQRVVEMEVTGGDPHASAPRLSVVGTFSYARTEDALDYEGLDFHQVEGIAVDDRLVLYLIVDNNLRVSRSFGSRRAALLRFFPRT